MRHVKYEVQPTIVGCYVRREHRRRKIGQKLVRGLVLRAWERGLLKEGVRLRLDAMSRAGAILAQATKREFPDLVEVIDQSDTGDMMGVGDFLD